ncbi:DUF1330 domain-containing protein [Acidipila sp. EB88]|uniref:DUF1330 domain-containing protein n=1 Tax=Acidipila sp. EB88 TaxID=2305226 RepID=UPI000F5F143C|nr:DUF1330 domain-containing protein [Acidipila sp. EB88]
MDQRCSSVSRGRSEASGGLRAVGIFEGDAGVRGVVLFEFPSMQKARHWSTSSAYQEVKRLRERAAGSDLTLVRGGIVPVAERMPISK